MERDRGAHFRCSYPTRIQSLTVIDESRLNDNEKYGMESGAACDWVRARRLQVALILPIRGPTSNSLYVVSCSDFHKKIFI
jgi:hypothetical protein